MSDIIKFLKKQIESDRAFALVVIEAEDCNYNAKWDFAASAFVDIGGSDIGDWIGTANDSRVAKFIVNNDPARALAECDAKLALIEGAWRDIYDIENEFGCCHDLGEIKRGECPKWHERDINNFSTLRILAAVYADRPGYSSDWAVTA
ncbi:hypothetical protein ABIB17_000483 [Arthrobacter sp. UYEF6]